MSTKKSKSKTARALAFAPAPVLKGEDAKAYDDLLTQVSSYVKPANIIEEMWVRDVVDLTWEILRCRRCKKQAIEAAIPKALEQAITPLMEGPSRFGYLDRYTFDGNRVPTPAIELVNEWIKREPKAKEGVEELLASVELTMADVTDRAFVLEIEALQQIDQLMAHAEARRNAVLREFECHRTSVAERLRKATQDVIDAECETVGPKAISQHTE